MNATVAVCVAAFLPMNGSDLASPQNFEMGTLISIFLMVIIALVGLTGNAVVLWLLGFRMWRNAFSVYILNLAGADFLLLCCQIIRSLQTLIYYFHSVCIDTYSLGITVFTFAYIAGLSLLSAISTERCLLVCRPIWYRCHRPRHMSAVVCALIWALSLVLSILIGNYCGFHFKSFPGCLEIGLITTGWLIVLFVLLSGSSLALVTRLLCGSQRVPLTRPFVTVMLTVLVFLLCGLPVGILGSFIWFPMNPYYSFRISCILHVLSCVNSCANPIIYFFVGSFRQRWRKGRQSLKLALQRALQDFPEGDEHGGSLPQEALEMARRGLGQ